MAAPAAPSMGWKSQFACGAAGVVTGIGAITAPIAPTERHEFVSCGLAKLQQHLETQGIRGSRSHIKDNVVLGTSTVGGNLSLKPNVATLGNFLTRIMGAVSTGTYTLTDNVPTFAVWVDKVAGVYYYDQCSVNKATFKSSKNQQLMLDMDIQGSYETGGQAFPALTLTAGQPLTHQQATITIGGVVRQADDLTITVDNALMLDRFFNSSTRLQLPATDRIVTVGMTVPFTADEVAALYDIGVASVVGLVVYTNAVNTVTINFPAMQLPAKSPTIPNRTGEILMPLEFTARQVNASAANTEMNVVIA